MILIIKIGLENWFQYPGIWIPFPNSPCLLIFTVCLTNKSKTGPSSSISMCGDHGLSFGENITVTGRNKINEIVNDKTNSIVEIQFDLV